MIRSPLFYVGDKYKLMPQIKEIFPKNIERFIDLFCGGGSVFLNSEAEAYEANDLNKNVISLHKLLTAKSKDRNCFFRELENIIEKYGLSASYLGKTAPIELKEKYVKTYYAVMNKEAYSKLRDDFNTDKSQIILLYVLLIYGFNHMIRFNSKGDFNLPIGNVDYNMNVVNALNGYFDFAQKHSVNFYSLDYKEFLSRIKLRKSDFIYIDPPYLISDSEYNKNWHIEEEKALLNQIDKIDKERIRFALSNVFLHKGRENTTLIEWSRRYNVHHLKANYISFNDNSIKNTDEVLICNY